SSSPRDRLDVGRAAGRRPRRLAPSARRHSPARPLPGRTRRPQRPSHDRHPAPATDRDPRPPDPPQPRPHPATTPGHLLLAEILTRIRALPTPTYPTPAYRPQSTTGTREPGAPTRATPTPAHPNT